MQFTLQQIKDLKSSSKTGADFPHLVQELKKLGVSSYISLVSDGHTEYFDSENESISTEANSDLPISDQVNKENFSGRLKIHQKGGTDYPAFCKDCAENGIDNWIVDLQKMTCTYHDKAGNEVLKEIIPTVN